MERVQRGVTKLQPPSNEDCAFDVRASVAKRGLVCTDGCQFKYRVRLLGRTFDVEVGVDSLLTYLLPY